MDKTYFLSQSTSLTLVITISLIFTIVGLIYSKKYQHVAKDNINYLDILFKNYKNKNLTKLKKNFKKSTVLEKKFWECFV